MNHFSLKNRKILITGASSGIGRQTAISVSLAGGIAIITGRDQKRLDETFRLLEGDKHIKVTADLTDESDIDNLAGMVEGLNGLVHCAGIIKPFPVKFIGKKQIDEINRINYDAPMIITGKLFRAKKFKKGASIVFMSSIASKFPYKGGALYCGTKAGIDAFSKVVALEYASQKIRSNCINAAMVKTPIFDETQKKRTKALMDAHEQEYPLGFGEPIDIANTVLFLLSDASRWITGTNIVMDGGLTAGI